MTYGIPYQGSKSRIAEALIRVLPSGKRFVDLFGGGAAMTHIAALSGKYESVLYNDIQPNLVKLVQDAIAGKYNYDVFTPEFITRERFFAEKETDAYVKYVWSFSNNGNNYLFSKDIEDIKHSIHDYIVYGKKDESLKKEFPQITLTKKDINGRRQEWRKQISKYIGEARWIQQQPQLERLQQLEQLQQLQQLQRLQQLQQIEFTCKDYREYEYEDGDVVYCDPPYENTYTYNKTEFDHGEFYEWVKSLPYLVFFSSFEISDGEFTKVWAKEKRSLGKGAQFYDMKIETLYVNHPIDFQFNNYEYVIAKQKEKQMTIFGGDK